MIITGLYYVGNAEKVAERVRREKWPFGGSPTFLRVAGLLFTAFIAYLLYTSIERSLDSDSLKPSVGWLWVWFIAGAITFSMGIWTMFMSRKWSEYVQSDQYRKTGFGTCLPLYSRRSFILFGAYELAWGVFWMWGGWPV